MESIEKNNMRSVASMFFLRVLGKAFVELKEVCTTHQGEAFVELG
jgi:hypothetical protein